MITRLGLSLLFHIGVVTARNSSESTTAISSIEEVNAINGGENVIVTSSGILSASTGGVYNVYEAFAERLQNDIELTRKDTYNAFYFSYSLNIDGRIKKKDKDCVLSTSVYGILLGVDRVPLDVGLIDYLSSSESGCDEIPLPGGIHRHVYRYLNRDALIGHYRCRSNGNIKYMDIFTYDRTVKTNVNVLDDRNSIDCVVGTRGVHDKYQALPHSKEKTMFFYNKVINYYSEENTKTGVTVMKVKIFDKDTHTEGNLKKRKAFIIKPIVGWMTLAEASIDYSLESYVTSLTEDYIRNNLHDPTNTCNKGKHLDIIIASIALRSLPPNILYDHFYGHVFNSYSLSLKEEDVKAFMDVCTIKKLETLFVEISFKQNQKQIIMQSPIVNNRRYSVKVRERYKCPNPCAYPYSYPYPYNIDMHTPKGTEYGSLGTGILENNKIDSQTGNGIKRDDVLFVYPYHPSPLDFFNQPHMITFKYAISSHIQMSPLQLTPDQEQIYLE
eukprot:GHVR01054865.1.p1 GENE.GHVR01054865.1~~GHVR01054865.1.p1  ORF type:complete len:499 (+),score=53.63 GHVR01054865.1:71-1567(+)